jgi:hypothetical protein
LSSGKVIVGDYHDDTTFRLIQKSRKEVVLHGKDIVAIPQVVCAPNLLSGVESLLQLAGFGKLKPNTILIGFKETYKESTEEDVHQYVSIISACFITHHSVCVFRNQHVPLKYKPEGSLEEFGSYSFPFPSSSPHLTLLSGGGFIDIWWLIEDGGFVFLLAYLLSLHRDYKKRNTRLRLFGLISGAASKTEKDDERIRLESLLERFRLTAEIVLIPYDHTPLASELETFFQLSKLDSASYEMNEETRTVLNVSSALKQYSLQAHVVMISMPVPKRRYADRQYLAYLDMLSCTGRPTFIARGNQQTVLTIHS